jgi:hypothetical protein
VIPMIVSPCKCYEFRSAQRTTFALLHLDEMTVPQAFPCRQSIPSHGHDRRGYPKTALADCAQSPRAQYIRNEVPYSSALCEV